MGCHAASSTLARRDMACKVDTGCQILLCCSKRAPTLEQVAYSQERQEANMWVGAGRQLLHMLTCIITIVRDILSLSFGPRAM